MKRLLAAALGAFLLMAIVFGLPGLGISMTTYDWPVLAYIGALLAVSVGFVGSILLLIYGFGGDGDQDDEAPAATPVDGGGRP